MSEGDSSSYQVTLDIALLWSAEIGRITILLTFHSAGVKNMPERNVFQSLSQSEERVLFAERIIPTGIIACSQGSREEWNWKVGSVEEWKFDCVMRKLTDQMSE